MKEERAISFDNEMGTILQNKKTLKDYLETSLKLKSHGHKRKNWKEKLSVSFWSMWTSPEIFEENKIQDWTLTIHLFL